MDEIKPYAFDTGVFEPTLLRRLPSPSSNNGIATASKQDSSQVMAQSDDESEESCDNNIASKSTVSFGGKMKSPFIGKTLPCGEDSDEEDDEDENDQATPTMQHPAPSDEKGVDSQYETEEELKAYDSRGYESKTEHSNISSDSEVSDGDFDTPCKKGVGSPAKSGLLTFVSGKQARSALGKEVHRPKPIMGGSPTPSSKLCSSNEDGSDEDEENDENSTSCSSNSSSSSDPIENDSRVDLSVDNDTHSPSDESSGNHDSTVESKDSSLSDVADDDSLSSKESENSSECPSESENEGAQVEDDENLSIEEENEGISSPLEMQLGAFGGNEILQVGGHETLKRTTEVAGRSPRNSLSLEDVESIIKDGTSPDEGIGPDSKMCFSEDDDEQNVPEKSSLFSEKKAPTSKLLLDSLEIERCSASVLAAVRSLCSQEAKNGESCQNGLIRLPGCTCESFWIDKMLPMLATDDSEAVKDLMLNSNRPAVSRQICDVFHYKLSSLDISPVTLPSSMDAAYASPIGQESSQLVFVGSLRAADCGIALLALRISHAIRIESSPSNDDVIDGVQHFSHILPCDGDLPSASKTVRNAAEDISNVFQNNPTASVLVACPTGNRYACAACALFLVRHFGMRKTDALDKISHSRPLSDVELSWMDSSSQDDMPELKYVKHPPFSKRILSSQMLSGSTETHTFTEAPKRQRRKESVSAVVMAEAKNAAIHPIPCLDLGPSLPSLKKRSTRQAEEQTLSSSECERYLSEELNASYTQKTSASTPVPLLTPPASPLLVNSYCGETTVCEWPSNLTVDTAMTATMSLSPPSPSLYSREEGRQNPALPPDDYLKTPRNQPMRALSTGLTPNLKGIQMSQR